MKYRFFTIPAQHSDDAQVRSANVSYLLTHNTQP